MDATTRARLLRRLAEEPKKEIERLLRRATLQLTFAKKFKETLGAGQTAGWDEMIAKAEARLNGLTGAEGVDAVRAALERAEADLAEIGQVAKTYTIHCVGHGHIDMNWMWSYQETVATTYDTFASILSFMEQYPQFTYSQSQASVYDMMERYHPEIFAKIKERVKEGRWEVAAAHWVEGDKNLVNGESLARHMLYTRRYFKEKFGLEPEDCPLDWEPDTFGHPESLPAILAQGGVKFYYCCRPGGGQDHARVGGPRPPLFYWQSPNGAQVLVNRETTWYNSYVNIGDDIATPMCNFVKETHVHHWLNVYGVGNHGGGPTRDEIDYYHELQDWPIYPTIAFSTCKVYYEAIEAEIERRGLTIPVLDHELNFEFTGCYTSQSLIKQANRFGENYCLEAEILGTLGSKAAGGMQYPQGLLREAWLGVLFNHFHDILPGSGVRETREHAMALFQESAARSGAIKRSAAEAIGAKINTAAMLPATPEGDAERDLIRLGTANTPFVAGSGIGARLKGHSQGSSGGRRFRPFLVFNSCAWTRSEVVRVDLYDMDLDPHRIVAIDPEGKKHQTSFFGKGFDWAHEKLTVGFLAEDVPALGYKVFLLCEGEPDAEDPVVEALHGEWYETPHLRYKLDRFNSGLVEVENLSTGSAVHGDWLASLGMWEKTLEVPRGMTAWVLGGEVDEPVPLKSEGFITRGFDYNAGTALPTRGSVVGVFESNLRVPETESSVQLRTIVHPLGARVDFEAQIDWREIGSVRAGIPGLAIRFAQLSSADTTKFETPFGCIDREWAEPGDVPTLRYAHLGGIHPDREGDAEYAGMTILQDCKYGHALADGEIRMRVVRSSFDPDHAPEVAQSTMRYAVVFHETEPSAAELTRLGAAFNQPLIVFPCNLQEGPWPGEQGFVKVKSDDVVLTSLKMAEDGSGLVLRLVEYDGEDAEVEIELHPSLVEGYTQATPVDLIERETDGVAGLNGTKLTLMVPAYSSAGVKLH